MHVQDCEQLPNTLHEKQGSPSISHISFGGVPATIPPKSILRSTDNVSTVPKEWMHVKQITMGVKELTPPK